MLPECQCFSAWAEVSTLPGLIVPEASLLGFLIIAFNTLNSQGLAKSSRSPLLCHCSPEASLPWLHQRHLFHGHAALRQRMVNCTMRPAPLLLVLLAAESGECCVTTLTWVQTSHCSDGLCFSANSQSLCNRSVQHILSVKDPCISSSDQPRACLHSDRLDVVLGSLPATYYG